MNRPRTSGEHLVAVLRSELTLVLLETSPPGEFAIDGAHFRDSGLGDFTGFYDWLRDFSGRPVGVRYCPSEAATARLGHVVAFSYIRDDGPCLEIRFGGKSPIDYANSADQAFGGNRVFMSSTGEVAVTFETYFLSDNELSAIQAAPSRWGSLVTDL